MELDLGGNWIGGFKTLKMESGCGCGFLIYELDPRPIIQTITN